MPWRLSLAWGSYMNFLNNLERKYGRYAVRNLPAVMIGLYVAGYILQTFSPSVLAFLRLEPYYIMHGQIWRIITWVIIPPSSLDIFTIIMLMFYFSIGQSLERTWGAFRFNVYIFTGIIFTVIGAFVLYAVYALLGMYSYNMVMIGYYFSTYYINMSIFLAFALSYPDMQVMLYFIIPVKMKWMGVLYGILIGYSFIRSAWPGRVAIIASLLNFIIFFISTRNPGRISPQQIRRRTAFHQSVRSARPASNNGARHKCAVCGRTELDDPSLEFRYCSKCDGAYEYCNDHLFTHQHVKKN
jgi:hypothetical protein